MVYLDDGVFGSYSGIVYDGARYRLSIAARSAGRVEPSVFAGPTCDSVDIIAEDVEVAELDIGDLVIGRTMGAYTAASASNFNMLPKATVVVTGYGAHEQVERPVSAAKLANAGYAT